MEEIELEIGLKKAIEYEDGFLCHWFGSQLNQLRSLTAESRERVKDIKNRLELLKQECDLRAKERVLYYLSNSKNNL